MILDILLPRSSAFGRGFGPFLTVFWSDHPERGYPLPLITPNMSVQALLT